MCFFRYTYSQIESDINNIKVEELIALSEIFNCEPNVFFEGI